MPNRAAEEAKRAAEEQAKRAADEQARRAAEEQAKKTADDQARRQAEERAKRQAEEQAKLQAEEQAKRQADEKAAADKAKSARAAELQAVSRALGEYTAAYGRKDANALQAVWPSIPKPVLEDVRNSFRYASEVKVDLRPLRDPEISGDTATVTCDRDLRQVVQKKVLEASTPVRIILNRRGAGWVIASIDAVKQ